MFELHTSDWEPPQHPILDRILSVLFLIAVIWIMVTSVSIVVTSLCDMVSHVSKIVIN